MPKVVIYSDLDGTLLDYDSYSFKASAEALDLIRSKNIPLILCTSKTRKEIELYRRQLNNDYPFISENNLKKTCTGKFREDSDLYRICTSD